MGFDIGGGAAIVVTMPSIGKRSEPPVAAIHELPTVDIARGINIRAASPRRRSIRLPTHDYSSPGAYYITLVTAQRTMLFGGVMEGIMQRSETGDVVSGLWQRLVDHYPEIELGDFTVMPNHVHGIIVINRREAIREMPLREDGVIRRRTRRQILLPKVIGRFQMTSAKSINEMLGRPVSQSGSATITNM
jgi:REP element-mobilizing transposase RayT